MQKKNHPSQQKTLASRLRAWLELREMTYQDLSMLSGVSRPAVGSIVLGARLGPGWITVRRLEGGLGLQDGDLTRGLKV